jgi:hypothetical protein
MKIVEFQDPVYNYSEGKDMVKEEVIAMEKRI